MLRYSKLLIILGVFVILLGCYIQKDMNSSNGIYSTAVIQEENTNDIKLIIYKNDDEDISSDIINNIEETVRFKYNDKNIEIEVKKVKSYLDF